MAKNKNHRGEYKIPDTVKEFFTLEKKKVKKQMAYASKKEINEEYHKRLILDDLPDVIDMLVFHSNDNRVKELKPYIFARLLSDQSAHPDKKDIIEYDSKKFMKYFQQFIEDEEEIENIELFPIIVGELCREVARLEAEEKAANPDSKMYFDINDIIDISTMILKKKLKKLTKAGVPKDLAFDCLSVIPCTEILRRGAMFRMRQLMVTLYNHAKTKDVDFETIMKYVVSKDYYPAMITFLLLERKSEYVNYDDAQKDFYNKVTDWCINTLECMEKSVIRESLTAYFNYRKKDKENNKDSNRRYFLSSIPENEFKQIWTVINKMKSDDPSIEEFL